MKKETISLIGSIAWKSALLLGLWLICVSLDNVAMAIRGSRLNAITSVEIVRGEIGIHGQGGQGYPVKIDK